MEIKQIDEGWWRQMTTKMDFMAMDVTFVTLKLLKSITVLDSLKFKRQLPQYPFLEVNHCK